MRLKSLEPEAFPLVHRKGQGSQAQLTGPAWACSGHRSPWNTGSALKVDFISSPPLPVAFGDWSSYKETKPEPPGFSSALFSASRSLFFLTNRDQGADWEGTPGAVSVSQLEAEGGLALCQGCVQHGHGRGLSVGTTRMPGISGMAQGFSSFISPCASGRRRGKLQGWEAKWRRMRTSWEPSPQTPQACRSATVGVRELQARLIRRLQVHPRELWLQQVPGSCCQG